MKRAIIIIRVSTPGQREHGHSLETQREAGYRYCEYMGWQVVAEFSDVASGTTLNRGDLNAARAFIRAGETDFVVVHDSSRLTRGGPGDAELLRREIWASGADLYYTTRGKAEKGANGEFLEDMFAAIDRRELSVIKERMQRGARGKVEKGIVLGHGIAPFGYQYEGERKETRLVPHPTESVTARLIFDWYDRGDTVLEIVRRLQMEGHATRADTTPKKAKRRGFAEWVPSSVYRILRHEVYAGTFKAYRWQRAENNRHVRRPKEENIAIAVPPLVPLDQWERAQQRLDNGRRDSPRGTQYEYLMGRRLLCHRCNLKMHSNARRATNLIYECLGRKGRTVRVCPCSLPIFHAEIVDAAVWQWVCQVLTDPVQIAEGFAAMQAGRAQAVESINEQLTILRARRDALDHQNTRLINLYTRAAISDAEFDAGRGEIDRERRDVLATVAQLEQQRREHRPMPAQAAIAEFTAQVRHGLDAATSFADRRAIVEALGVRGSCAEEDNQRVLYVSSTVILPEVASVSQTYLGLQESCTLDLSARLILGKHVRGGR